MNTVALENRTLNSIIDACARHFDPNVYFGKLYRDLWSTVEDPTITENDVHGERGKVKTCEFRRAGQATPVLLPEPGPFV